MSQSPTAIMSARSGSPDTESVHTVANEQSIQELLDVLDDADCRAILDATSDTALSAHEVSEACELPLSTTYRKLDLLTSAKLLEEQVRIRRSGSHASEYLRSVTDVVISISTHGEVELQLSHRETSGEAGQSTSVIGN